jgi:hypothetical protein
VVTDSAFNTHPSVVQGLQNRPSFSRKYFDEFKVQGNDRHELEARVKIRIRVKA